MLSAVGIALAADSANGYNGSDQFFLSDAAGFDMVQAHEGEMALTAARSEEVRNLAHRMIQAHTASYQQLSVIAQKTGMTIPRAIDAGTNNLIIGLTKLRDARFDRQFAEDQVEQYKQEIVVYDQETRNGKNADLKAYASRTLPILKEHLNQAEACQHDGNKRPDAS
jgi:putative membrane protein